MAEGPAKAPGSDDPTGQPTGYRPVLAATAVSVGMIVFALAAHTSLPTFSLALSGLLLTTVAIATSFRGADSPGGLFGITKLAGPVFFWCFVGLLLGVGLALLFRHTSHQPLLLTDIQPFVFTAMAIGAAEELLFRGFIQGRFARLGWPAAVLLATLAHTAYKSALFAFPQEAWVTRFFIVAFFTFLVGSMLGLMRHFSGSVLPAVTAHVLFDILVYGDWAQAPWWVWG